MGINCKILLIAAVFLTASTQPAYADEEKHGQKQTSHHYHRHLLELFLGGTYEDGDHGSKNGFASGLVYEYRINELLGTGGFIKYAGESIDAWTGGIPLFIHPYKGFRFTLAPGLEYKHHETEFLFRVGAGYEFVISPKWAITPEINVDFVNGEELYVFGLSFGIGLP
jgi:hypothetical protein